MNRPFFEALKAIIPGDRLLTRDVELLPYESDALTAFQTKPGAVALPITEDEIIDTVRLCHKMKVPFCGTWQRHQLVRRIAADRGRLDDRLEPPESHQEDRPAAAHCGRRTGRDQLAYHRRGAAVRLVLRAGSIESVRLHDRRQYRLQQRRRSLPESMA